MNRTYRYRIYSTPKQAAALARHLEVHRQVYNAGLQEFRETWDRRRVTRRHTDPARQLRALRVEDPEVAFANHSALQQTLRRLEAARVAFFRRVKAGQAPGYPRFKSRTRFTTLAYRWGDGIRLTRSGRLYVQRAGDIKLKLHRPIPAGATTTMALLTRGVRTWTVVLCLEIPDPQPLVHLGPPVSLDVGLHTLAALSDGLASPIHAGARPRRRSSLRPSGCSAAGTSVRSAGGHSDALWPGTTNASRPSAAISCTSSRRISSRDTA